MCPWYNNFIKHTSVSNRWNSSVLKVSIQKSPYPATVSPPATKSPAQLGERLNGIQEVSGSIPLISTKSGKSEFKEKFWNRKVSELFLLLSQGKCSVIYILTFMPRHTTKTAELCSTEFEPSYPDFTKVSTFPYNPPPGAENASSYRLIAACLEDSCAWA